jgi:hypothetical protein
MDEAANIGLGKYLKINGYEDRYTIFINHLKKVLQLCDKYGFCCSVWSDMFFKTAFNKEYYVKDKQFSKDIIDSLPENVKLIYWDYYNTSESCFAEMIDIHTLQW